MPLKLSPITTQWCFQFTISSTHVPDISRTVITRQSLLDTPNKLSWHMGGLNKSINDVLSDPCVCSLTVVELSTSSPMRLLSSKYARHLIASSLTARWSKNINQKVTFPGYKKRYGIICVALPTLIANIEQNSMLSSTAQMHTLK